MNAQQRLDHGISPFDALRRESLLADVARRHRVPGIVAGAIRVDAQSGRTQRFVSSTGVTNLRTGVETTPDTLCQIGSITKIVTATMIMQLREEGRLELDTPIAELLPGISFAEVDAASVTVRHLLTHTSGIDGDVFTDTGRGDDALERYVSALSESRSLFSPGSGWSYCNSGWSILGRVIEVLDGGTWDASLQKRISARLGLRQFLTLPEDVMSHRYQHGHVREPGKRDWVLAPVSTIVRSMGPAGLISSSADDLLDFAAAFLRGGRGRPGAAGEALLSQESVRLMTETHVTLDAAAGAIVPRWGLGWMLNDWQGHATISHGGTTIGNKAWLEVLPDDGVAIVVFCNGGVHELAGPEILAAIAQELVGAAPGPGTSPSGPAIEAEIDDALLGSYADFNTRVEVARAEDGTLLATLAKLHEPGGASAVRVQLLPAGTANHFVARADALSPWTRVAFTEVDGRSCVYVDVRCLPKQEEVAA